MTSVMTAQSKSRYTAGRPRSLVNPLSGEVADPTAAVAQRQRSRSDSGRAAGRGGSSLRSRHPPQGLTPLFPPKGIWLPFSVSLHTAHPSDLGYFHEKPLSGGGEGLRSLHRQRRGGFRPNPLPQKALCPPCQWGQSREAPFSCSTVLGPSRNGSSESLERGRCED
jgi:hypothetical protein